MRNLLALGFAAFVLASCVTAQVPQEEQVPPPAPVVEAEPEHVDLEGLERALKLARPEQELGYKEASFNSCSIGYGFSSSKDCRKMTMAVINFRLQCRDSVDTVSTALSAADLVAISGQRVRWTIQKQDGTATTDGDGYASLRAVFPRSPKNDWLRIAVGVQFLNMRANTITRVVTPRPWCHQDRD